MRLISDKPTEARATAAPDDALVPTENALWRLAAAREKLHAIIALAFGVPCLRITRPTRRVLFVRVDERATKARLQDITHPEAREVLGADATLKSCLLLRHQLSHSLAPIVKAASVAWVEIGHGRNGGVYGYQAIALLPEGLPNTGLTSETLLQRALGQLEKGLGALDSATAKLASLIDAAGELEPPPVLWRADETGLLYATREEASAASRASSREAGS
ncbi:MAG: hypothetical protein IT201_14040 [Thermoleophilia bacterium]|nr:hypothetical protein [Thermoleophilia bacterium]